MKLKRLLAYIIDILIVGFVASAISSIEVINPYYDNYIEAYEKYSKEMDSLNEDNVFDKIKSEEFVLDYQNVLKYGVYSSVISISCYILYFGGFQKWNKNQTVGKKLMRLKVVNKNNKDDVRLWQYILRTIIVYNLLFNSLSVVVSYMFKGNLFFTTSIITSIIGYVITYVGYIMILFRKDGCGLHDFVSGTKVVEV
jgi:uncharacterized RDD family membrane protein YckC